MVGLETPSGTDSAKPEKPNEMSPLETSNVDDQSTYFTEKISIPETEEKVTK